MSTTETVPASGVPGATTTTETVPPSAPRGPSGPTRCATTRSWSRPRAKPSRSPGPRRRLRRLRAARRSDRHAIPPLPQPPNAARGGLCRRGRRALPVGCRVRRARALGCLGRLASPLRRLSGDQAGARQELLNYVDRDATVFQGCRSVLFAAGEPLLERRSGPRSSAATPTCGRSPRWSAGSRRSGHRAGGDRPHPRSRARRPALPRIGPVAPAPAHPARSDASSRSRPSVPSCSSAGATIVMRVTRSP